MGGQFYGLGPPQFFPPQNPPMGGAYPLPLGQNQAPQQQPWSQNRPNRPNRPLPPARNAPYNPNPNQAMPPPAPVVLPPIHLAPGRPPPPMYGGPMAPVPGLPLMPPPNGGWEPGPGRRDRGRDRDDRDRRGLPRSPPKTNTLNYG